MCRLQFARWLGEEEGAPVGHAADDALLFKDDSAGSFGDSVCTVVRGRTCGVEDGWEGDEGDGTL